MNDHDAMTAINEALSTWFKGGADEHETLRRIAVIAGQNAHEHEQAKP